MKKNKNKKGFTLIELLAVIIILGILMIIAIPAVTKYISGSRKDAYVETAKEVVKGAVNLVNSGELQMRDIDATYYMPSSCVRVENGGVAKSPYGEFEPAYIVINYNGSGEGYDYYWMSRDDTGTGVKSPVSIDDLDTDDIETDITEQDILDNITTIDKRTKFIFFNEDCTSKTDQKPTSFGKLLPVNECDYDGLMTLGAEFTDGQYTYRFMQQSNGMNGTTNTWSNIEDEGWGVVLTNKESTEPVNTRICTSINGKPIVSMQYMFYNSKASSIDVSSFDTSNVKNMNYMFLSASNVKELNLSRFDTANMTTYYSIFNGCTSLETLNMDNWNFGKTGSSSAGGGALYNNNSLKTISARNWVLPETFTHIFSRTWGGSGTPIESIDVTGWDLSKTTDISGIFGDSRSLKTIIGMNTWNTSKVTYYQNMFGNCESLTEVNMDNWDLSRTESSNPGGGMFSGATAIKTISAKNWKLPKTFTHVFSRTFSGGSSPIETIDVTGWDLSITNDIQGLFGDSKSLKKIIGMDTWDTSKIKSFNNFFYNCESLTDFDISHFDTKNVTDMTAMFYNCKSIKSIDLSNFRTPKLTTYPAMFQNCTSLESVNMDNWDLSKTGGSGGGGSLFSGTTSIKTISARNWKLPGTFTHVFSRTFAGSGSPIETIDVTGWDLSNTTDIQGLYGDSQSLKKIIGMETWDTSRITSLNNFFYNCRNLTDYDLSHFDTRNVTDMTVMFYNNAFVKSIDLSNFRTPNLTSYSAMFSGCDSLETLNMDNWDLTKAGVSGGHFSGCLHLKTVSAKNWKLPATFTHWISRSWSGGSSPIETIDVTGWNLTNTTNIEGLFADSQHVKQIIGLNTWNTSGITNMNQLFYQVGRTASTLDLGNLSSWNTGNVTNMNQLFMYAGQDASRFNVNVSGWNTGKVQVMSQTFSYAGQLATDWSIGTLNNWNVSNVTTMQSMFDGAGYRASTFNIGDLSNWDTSKVTTMYAMFYGAGKESTNFTNIGTLKVYAPNIYGLFQQSNNAKATVNLYTNPTTYSYAFADAATLNGSGITVNYASSVSNIDNVIATKTTYSKVTKGNVLS